MTRLPKRKANGSSSRTSMKLDGRNRAAKQGRPKDSGTSNDEGSDEARARRYGSASRSNEHDIRHDDDDDESGHLSDDDDDVDQPRVAQWQPEEDSDESEVESVDDRGEGPSKLRQTKPVDEEAGLGSMSFGSILKAKRILERAEAESGSDSDSDSSESGSDSVEGVPARERLQPSSDKPKVPATRAHKHAPTEMTSKRPVTRRRQVVAVQKSTPRDPRFTSVGQDDGKFKQHYSFLDDLHVDELKTLKDNLKRTQKLLRSSPRDLRQEREEEVERLTRTVKRAESTVNKDRKEAIEGAALESVRNEERERRKSGKKEWHMKDTEKRGLLLKARHDFLRETGGRSAVRKAIEKKQMKTSQKEKKQRPAFVQRPRTLAGASTDSGDTRKRKRSRIE